MEMDRATRQEHDEPLARLETLTRFGGSPAEFWGLFFEGCVAMVGARYGLLAVKNPEEGWNRLGVWPVSKKGVAGRSDEAERIAEAASAAVELGSVLLTFENGSRESLVAVSLDVGDGEVCAGVFSMGDASHSDLSSALATLRLAASIPMLYLARREAEKAQNDVVVFGDTLDLMVLVNTETRFVATAMTFVNEAASRYGCSRVSLGWLDGPYVRVQAVSHMEKFEAKTEAVQLLETAMEEAFDQDEEVVWPQAEHSSAVVRAHGEYGSSCGAGQMVSLPLRLDEKPVGVVTCERDEASFSEKEIYGLRLLCDQAARRLSDLKETDRWVGARFASWSREKLSGLLGVEHTFGKLMGIIGALLLAFLLFGKLEYRVEAPFVIKSDDVAYLPAPFDGYIREVHSQPGDAVGKGGTLLYLDTRELFLEESAAIADQMRYAREAEKARAKHSLADMKIAQALKSQADARLALIRYHLGNAQIQAPFSGIVVEGDLKEMLGAPVRKGDVLFKVARIERMYAELDLDERDVHEINAGDTGEIAFVSMPESKYPITVSLIDPVAVSKEEGNIFPVRCTLENAEPWWRPGMSGVSKVNAGKRNVLWILAHRTVDFFRLLLWW